MTQTDNEKLIMAIRDSVNKTADKLGMPIDEGIKDMQGNRLQYHTSTCKHPSLPDGGITSTYSRYGNNET
jgi:hypothetical protein